MWRGKKKKMKKKKALIKARKNPRLPENVMRMILSRIPLRDVLRFSCVCRYWYLRIYQPIFINMHLENSLLLNHHEHPVICSAYDDTNPAYKPVCLINTTGPPTRIFNVQTHSTFDSNYPDKINFFDFSKNMVLAGSVNGVVCLSHSQDEINCRFVALWNPALSLWKPIPLPVSHSGYHVINKVSVGLGFDKAGDDFKIVRIVPVVYPPESTWSRLEIYSSKADSWKHLGTESFINFWPKLPNCSFIVDGVPYWVGVDGIPQDQDNPYECEMLGCIDPCTGSFKKVRYPEYVMNERTRVHPTRLKDSVAALIQYPSNDCQQIMVDLYVLNEKAASWTKMKNIRPLPSHELRTKMNIIGPLPSHELRIPQCFNTGEIVLETWKGDIQDAVRFPFFCDPATGVVRPNKALNALQPIWDESYSHVESLVTVKGMERIVKEEKEITDSEEKMWDELLPKVLEAVLNL